jgi:release factor glutamine methyltransferase
MAKTYNDIYLDARRRFRDAEISGFALEARILLAHLAGKSAAEFIRDSRLYVSKQYEIEAEALITRRLNGEPAAYLTGSWEFFGLPLAVSKDVLIPRTDTETVVRTAIDLLKNRGPCRVLDLCCGSGCIGLALADQLPDARLILADYSEAAVKLSRNNAVSNKLAARVGVVSCDARKEPPCVLGTFFMIVSNPPYIETGALAGLDPSVRDFEPRCALDGGLDGLDFYRSICEKWQAVIQDQGFLVFECGAQQSAAVCAIGRSAGLVHIDTVKDTLGIDRVVVLQKGNAAGTELRKENLF